jgi:ABC-type multidrug transport system fused ATPase/permease subunit
MTSTVPECETPEERRTAKNLRPQHETRRPEGGFLATLHQETRPERPVPSRRGSSPDGSDSLTHEQTVSESKISVRDFDFFYGTAKVLHGISLEIPARKVTALIGPSGCG